MTIKPLYIAGLVFLLYGIPGFATTPEDAYDEAQKILTADPTASEYYNVDLHDYLFEMAQTKASTDSMGEKILDLQWELANDADNDQMIRRMAIQGFRHQKLDSVENLVKGYLDSTNYWLRIAAAEVDIEFGNSDGVDVLIDEEVFSALEHYDVPGLQTILENAMKSASPLGKMRAAYQLQKIDEYFDIYEASLEIIEGYVNRDSSYSSASNVNAAVFWGFVFAQKEPWNAMESLVQIAVEDTSLAFRTAGMLALGSYAADSVEAAWDMAESLVGSSSYEDVLNKAHFIFNQYVEKDNRYWSQP